MRIIPREKVVIQEIVVELKAGKTIVYPTETCYGLGCDALNAEAVVKIFTSKGRETGKPMLMLASSIGEVKTFIEWNEIIEKLALDHWPGALTIVAKAKNSREWPAGIIGADNTLAFRVSSHPLITNILQEFNNPIVSTSANFSGGENPYRVEQIINSLGQGKTKPDTVIDAGDLPLQLPSTVVQVLDNHIKILRQGLIVL
ncbi:MAG: threonylcarbamoyl-AMP synthase [Candidatus Magasanikbacteria bacterium RIFCSPHIGHO2_01_FULL_41_23]|uniref:L-threonylcarbamoyladenylate synthase n=1 Tax=Candidatus Magasanikbacteria bacterium RIFCSPLOWO2_01_FULL_40_15 TaxID=1798686 RepID=A0A1F6N494_9BACT|nr:MAG: threonylcarbamoyl-AMP synthase [Candidatus Magasanikbacteria bacterium RIFCSPHIGHO2_01_FULL_41_23]OGH67158.1 MAG: threonylcarbamoyl-AMP synthase [Candidatus Magasanikbacteria bacterium RIFCSPHIGHO2_02_FULL_41_35]OGH75477.1 MAG: threonylcarbamoyl-AMP synthase [Candidatus Magasanikbacteria bacterium RIFCSPHIGHO2_12_FULL_41_16]OGH78694.1 MAG: threonylcarbamoyl-AMP synthase [Candidatus Magasanikbacteria bacterium RIFCSPLOWO2_01_FULL_40_15]